MKRSLSALALAAAASLALAACGSAADGSTQKPGASAAPGAQVPAAVAQAGKFTVCVNIAYPPYEFFKTGTQEPDGSDIEIAAAVAKHWGVPVEYSNIGFEGLIAAVNARKCHASISGMSPLPKRLEGASFVVYQQNGSLIMVPKGNPGGVTDLETLSGKRVGVMLGSSQSKVLEEASADLEKAGKAKITIATYPKDTDAPAAMVAGKLDAYFAAGPSIMGRVKQAPDSFEVVGDLQRPELLAAVTRKDDKEMLAALSTTFKQLYSNGRMAEILEKWDMSKEALPDSLQGEIRE
ncbi:MAG: ABC transporter substrate-binding protein [Intrasporangium sp.]|uniref:ABC transporter substrate-binding protein n=1 Tax=Intrasporangium sp. TaxID=1925024 RepID=UPI003F7D1352